MAHRRVKTSTLRRYEFEYEFRYIINPMGMPSWRDWKVGRVWVADD